MSKRNCSDEAEGIRSESRRVGDKEGLEKRGATAIRRESRFSLITEVRRCLSEMGAGGGMGAGCGTDVEVDDESSTKNGGESERDN